MCALIKKGTFSLGVPKLKSNPDPLNKKLLNWIMDKATPAQSSFLALG